MNNHQHSSVLLTLHTSLLKSSNTEPSAPLTWQTLARGGGGGLFWLADSGIPAHVSIYGFLCYKSPKNKSFVCKIGLYGNHVVNNQRHWKTHYTDRNLPTYWKLGRQVLAYTWIMAYYNLQSWDRPKSTATYIHQVITLWNSKYIALVSFGKLTHFQNHFMYFIRNYQFCLEEL